MRSKKRPTQSRGERPQKRFDRLLFIAVAAVLVLGIGVALKSERDDLIDSSIGRPWSPTSKKAASADGSANTPKAPFPEPKKVLTPEEIKRGKW